MRNLEHELIKRRCKTVADGIIGCTINNSDGVCGVF